MVHNTIIGFVIRFKDIEVQYLTIIEKLLLQLYASSLLSTTTTPLVT